jgi:hypothetical protein
MGCSLFSHFAEIPPGRTGLGTVATTRHSAADAVLGVGLEASIVGLKGQQPSDDFTPAESEATQIYPG